MRARAVDLELQRAAKAGNAKLMKQLLARGGRLDAQDPDGWTALHAAAAEGRTSVVHVICSYEGDYDVNALTGDGRTPLYFASLEGSVECVSVLLEHGANAHVRTTDDKARNAGEVAALFGHSEVAAVLSEALSRPPPEPRPMNAAPPQDGQKEAGKTGGHESCREHAVVNPEVALRAKAEEYAARKPQEWKKNDFTKWGQMNDADWEGLEAEYELKAADAKPTSEPRLTKSAHSTSPGGDAEAAKQPGGGGGRKGYGSSKIGPPSGPQITADHPRYEVWQDYVRLKERWENPKANDFKDELISFKPPPEGGCPPNQANGGEGPFYAWAQTPSEVHVTIEVDQGTTKQDVECDIRPERLSLLVKRMGGGRGLKVFHRATLWRRVKAEESMWTLDGLLLTITLSKSEAQWWRCVSDIEGHPKIDSTLCKGPELISEYEGDAAEELRQFFGKQLANPLRR